MRTHVVDLFLRPNGVLVMFFDGEIKMWNIESDSVKSMLGNIEPFEIKGCVQELTVFALGPNYSKNLVVIYRNNGFGIDSMESIFVSPFLHD